MNIRRWAVFIATFVIGISAARMMDLPTVPSQVEAPGSIAEIGAHLVDRPASENPAGEPRIVQSSVVRFPSIGKVVVEASEKIGELPRMSFSVPETRKTLLSQEIKDPKKYFYPIENDDGRFGPFTRYRVLNDTGTHSPVVMAITIYPGGSDDGFYLSLFMESKGKIVDITPRPPANNVQGGWYFGYLGPRYRYGLADWSFVWAIGDEAHYSSHRYENEVYKLVGTKLVRILRRESRRKYDQGNRSLREIGIPGLKDQREGIPFLKDYLDLEP